MDSAIRLSPEVFVVLSTIPNRPTRSVWPLCCVCVVVSQYALALGVDESFFRIEAGLGESESLKNHLIDRKLSSAGVLPIDGLYRWKELCGLGGLIRENFLLGLHLLAAASESSAQLHCSVNPRIDHGNRANVLFNQMGAWMEALSFPTIFIW